MPPAKERAEGRPLGSEETISAQLWVGVAGLAGMVVSRGRSVERSRWAGSHIRCRLRLWPGFRTTCSLAGASPWRGSLEVRERQVRSLELGVPATVVTPGQGQGGGRSHGGGDDRDRSAQGLAYRGGDRPGGSAAGPAAGTGLRRPGGAAAGMGAGLAAAHLGGRRRGRAGASAGPAAARRG